MQDGAVERKGGILWMLASLPANVAAGPLSLLVTLYILELGGGALNVAYAMTLSSAITIPSVFLWGYITDLLNRRRVFIVVSYLSTALLILSLFFVKSVFAVTIIYAAVAFTWAANGAPLNLLVMENAEENRWARNFSVLQTISGAGATLGYLIAWIVTGVSTLNMLLLVLASSALASSVMAAKLIEEPTAASIRTALQDGVHAFVYRIISIPNMLIRIPSPTNIKNLFKFKGFASIEKEFVLVFYLISFIFFFGSSIFNTEYPVGLKLSGMSEALIFFLSLLAMIVQVTIFYYYDKLTVNKNSKKIATLSLVGRGGAYAAMGLMFIFIRGLSFYVGNFIFYIFAIGVAYSIYYPTSYSILFKTLAGKKKGSSIGIYSAVIGLGTLSGALISGAMSVAFGFGITFVFAGGLMLLCGYMFRLLPKITSAATPAPSGS